MKEVLETVVETPYESHEAFLSRRSMAMAGMLGTLSGRLEILSMEMRLAVEYPLSNKDFLKSQLRELRMSTLETLIKYNREWAEMQDYKVGEYMKESSDKKISEFTTELEALKTLAL